MDRLLAIEGLAKHFGPIVAVDDVSFTVERGEVLGFLGPNGAGKSTTMKMITGFLAPTAAGRGLRHRHRARSRSRSAQIGYLPEGAPAYGDMTPRGFLDFVAEYARLQGAERRQRIDRACRRRLQLEAVLDQPIETLSKGFKRRVGLAQALLHDPRGAGPRRADRRPRPQPEARGAPADRRTWPPTRRSSSRPTSSKKSTRSAPARSSSPRAGIVADGTPDELESPLAQPPSGDALPAGDARSSPRGAGRHGRGRDPGRGSDARRGAASCIALPARRADDLRPQVSAWCASGLARRRHRRRARPSRRGVPQLTQAARASGGPGGDSDARDLTIGRRELASLFRHAARLRLHHHLPGARRRVHLLHRQFLRAGPGRSDLVLHLPSLALPVPDAGASHAAVGRGAEDRHGRAVADPAGLDVAGGAGQVPRRLAVRRHRAGADLPDLAHGQLSGQSR